MAFPLTVPFSTVYFRIGQDRHLTFVHWRLFKNVFIERDHSLFCFCLPQVVFAVSRLWNVFPQTPMSCVAFLVANPGYSRQNTIANRTPVLRNATCQHAMAPVHAALLWRDGAIFSCLRSTKWEAFPTVIHFVPHCSNGWAMILVCFEQPYWIWFRDYIKFEVRPWNNQQQRLVPPKRMNRFHMSCGHSVLLRTFENEQFGQNTRYSKIVVRQQYALHWLTTGLYNTRVYFFHSLYNHNRTAVFLALDPELFSSPTGTQVGTLAQAAAAEPPKCLKRAAGTNNVTI